MVNLRVYVEGWGEYRFVQDLLVAHLQAFGVFVQASRIGHLTGKPRLGIGNWEGEHGTGRELQRALLQSSSRYSLYVTTMVDYYALPRDWPNRENSSELPKPDRSSRVESGMYKYMRELLGNDERITRFVPYVSLHEFEALLLSKPEALLAFFPGEEAAVQKLRDDVSTLAPEHVDDDPCFAPSKRIIRFLPGYASQKSAAAIHALRAIGMEHLRQACPHFGQWLGRLEALA